MAEGGEIPPEPLELRDVDERYRMRLHYRGLYWVAEITGYGILDFAPPVRRSGWTAVHAQRRAVRRADRHRFGRQREVRVGSEREHG